MATNVEAIAIEDLRSNFFAIMEEVCKDDMDEAALAAYQERHSDEESQDQEAA